MFLKAEENREFWVKLESDGIKHALHNSYERKIHANQEATLYVARAQNACHPEVLWCIQTNIKNSLCVYLPWNVYAHNLLLCKNISTLLEHVVNIYASLYIGTLYHLKINSIVFNINALCLFPRINKELLRNALHKNIFQPLLNWKLHNSARKRSPNDSS